MCNYRKSDRREYPLLYGRFFYGFYELLFMPYSLNWYTVSCSFGYILLRSGMGSAFFGESLGKLAAGDRKAVV